MTSQPGWSLHNCRVVVGADAVVSLRSDDPIVPVVALVDGSSPTDLVLAQVAGADVVLAVRELAIDAGRPAGLDLAIRAAITNAERRNEVAATSRRAGHDVAGALNVIGLITEAGQHGHLDHAAAFGQIKELVRGAGNEAWRVGRGHRASSLVVGCVDLRRVLGNGKLPGDVTLAIADGGMLVFVDEDWLGDALCELVGNARRAGAANISIAVSTVADGDVVEVVVSDDGIGFCSEFAGIGQPFSAEADSERLGIGLASIAERAVELGGRLELRDSGNDGTLTRVALTLRRIDPAFLEGVVEQRPSAGPSAAQANILEGVVRHAPLDESLEGIVAAIENQLPGTMCSVLLLHDGCRLRHGAGAGLPLEYREAIDGVEIGVGQGSCGTAAYTGRPVVASDVTTDRNWIDFRSIATEHGLRSCWSTPIVAAEGGETLGTFAVYTARVWSPDETAIRLVNRFTYLAAVAIDHHRLFGALAESEARFRGAFEGAAAGIALVSLEGVIQKSNPALDELVIRSAAYLAGTSFLDLVDPWYRSLVTESWAELTDEETAGIDTVEVPLEQGPDEAGLEESQTWLSLHTSLIPGEPGRQPYLYVEVRDVTAARQQLADMRAREAAEAANSAKSDFLALASHELRTPLNAILGFAQVMQLLELDEDQRADSVDRIINAGRHLRDLIDELLDLSRIESGHLAVEAEPVDVYTVIDEAIEIVGPLAAARNIELVGQMEATRAPVVLADRRCMRQVLINLLDNAVKYTPRGGRVDVALVAVTPNGATANGSNASGERIKVTDTGAGISSDSLDAIFQPFHRLDRAADGASEGTGLGLALCARLMREMDGLIGVTSTVGLGSSFWIEFPAVTLIDGEAANAVPGGLTVETAPAELAEGKVLYIEDDQASVDLMFEALRLRPGISLSAACSAEEGATAIASDQYEVVLLDVGLPDRSGWELLGELRAGHPTLPVIVLTAGDDVVPSGVALPDRVFTKPVDVSDVLRAIDRACLGGSADGNLFTETVDARYQ